MLGGVDLEPGEIFSALDVLAAALSTLLSSATAYGKSALASRPSRLSGLRNTCRVYGIN